ncbi:arginase family protein [Agromyces sp. MMS24-K17]|uniref:arginase family protein n=1 Tax=Agromyces sp. MMS24-K17 TaxID=3372850 RepID=UPI0037544113
MSHADGASAIQGDLPSSATVVVDVPMEAGESLDTGVRRYSALRRVRERTEQALAGVTGLAITIGGDCAAALPAIAHAARSGDGPLGLLWLDAHPDLHTPETSPSGNFGGMVLRAVLGEGAEGLALAGDERVAPGRVVLGGARAVDEEEARFVEEHGIALLTPGDLADPSTVVAALEATGAERVFVHVDLDVLDPSALAGLSYPLPFGVDTPELVALLRAVVARFPIAGAAIAGFAPSSPEAATDDLPAILRIVGAISAAGARAAAPDEEAVDGS